MAKLFVKFLVVAIFICSAILAFAQKQGKESLDSMLAEVPKMKQDTNGVKLLAHIGGEYANINPKIGISYATRTLALAQKNGWRYGEARAYDVFAGNYLQMADYPAALNAYFKALRIYEEVEHPRGIQIITMRIGNVYFSIESYPKALEYYFKALGMAEKLGDERGVQGILGNIGSVYGDQGNHKLALEYARKSLKMAEKHRNKIRMSDELESIGNTYAILNEHQHALTYLNDALQISKEIGDKRSVASTLGDIGSVYLSMAKSPSNAENKTIYLAKTFEYLNKAITASMEVHHNDGLINAYYDLSQAYELQGNYKAALKAFQKHIERYDSLYNIKSDEKIANLETKRALELKDKDIQIAKLAVAKKRNERWFFMAGIGLLLTVVGVQLRSFRVQKQGNAQLNIMVAMQESERRRISRDLHDDIGTKLSAIGLFISSMKEKAAGGNNEIFSLAKNSEQFIKETVQDLRQLLLDLSPSVLEEFGYTTAVEGLVNKINETRLIHFNLIVFGIKERLPKTYELALYRITQELINNVLKHAAAKQVTLQIGLRDDKIVLMIEDDGKGFDIAANSDGYGLKTLLHARS